MKKLSIAMTTVLVIALLATSAFAFGWGRGWGRGPGDGMCQGVNDKVFSEMNLTAEQTAKMKALKEASLKEITPIKEKMFSKRNELRLLWLKDNPDEAKILAVQKEMRSLRDQMEDKMTSHRLAAFKVLTPEQQKKIQAFDPGKGRGPGFGRCQRGGPGGGGPDGPGPGNGRGNW